MVLLTVMSATVPACELAKPPIAIPRPVTVLPVCLTRVRDLRLPAGEVRDSREHLAPLVEAVVHLLLGDVLEPELVRIHVRRVGELVDQLLRGERSLRRIRRAQRRRLEVVVQRRNRLQVVAALERADVVLRPGVARVRRSAGRARSGDREADQRLGRRDRVGGHRVAGVVETDDVAVVVDPAAHVEHHRLAVVVPAVLVPAHVLDADGLAEDLRHEGRGLAGVDVDGAAAERARALVVDDPDLVDRKAQHRRDLRTRGP